MGLFSEPKPSVAYLKAGLLGFNGSGKTYTAAMLMIGLIEHLRKLGIKEAEKPVYFIDSESGFPYIERHFIRHKIKTRIAKTRAFSDLPLAIQEAEANGIGLITDSVTHFWNEFMQAYKRKRNRQYIKFNDWQFLKEEWNDKFAIPYVNSKLHFIVCGRAGYEYDYSEDEDGKKELEKTGIRMKAEGEFSYEPSLLVLMERHFDLKTKTAWREAHILKERFTVIDGETFSFKNPKSVDEDTSNEVFETFLPHIQLINLGGKHLSIDTSRTSDESIPEIGKDNWEVEKRQREILSEEIQGLLLKYYPSRKEEDIKAKADLLEEFFKTRSWTKIQTTNSKELKTGFQLLKEKLEPTPITIPPQQGEQNNATL